MKKNLLICGALLAALTVTACAAASGAAAQPPVQSAAPAASVEAPAVRRARGWGWNYNGQSMKYTKADYALLQSFQFDGYEKMSIAEFNAKILDWADEDAYHKTEYALMRLRWSLPDADPLTPFLDTVIRHTWNECELKHYNACERSKYPTADGYAAYEKYADVYGDQVLIAGGYADFWYDYEMPDESKVTVAEREAFLKSIEDGMQAYLNKQTETAMKDQEAMQKSLKAELDRLLKELSTAKIKGSDGEISYYWDRMY